MPVTETARKGPAALTSAIRDEARRLGFFKVGVARAGPLPGREHLQAWLETGMHGEMEYIKRQAAKRADPGLVLEHARSIVVLAMNYYSGQDFTHELLRGRISRYAWGGDYHIPVKARLSELRSFIEEQAPGIRCLDYVDTGPVMEKVWGAQTALGWMGKHSNVITR